MSRQLLTVIGYIREIEKLLKSQIIPTSVIHIIFAFHVNANLINYILKPSDNNHLYTDDCKSLFQFILNRILSDFKHLETTNDESRDALNFAIHLPLNIIISYSNKPLNADSIYQKSLFLASFEFFESIISDITTSNINKTQIKICMKSMINLRDKLIENIQKPKEVLNIDENEMELTQYIHRLIYLLTTIDITGMTAKIMDILSIQNMNDKDVILLSKWSWIVGIISGSMPMEIEKEIFINTIKKLLYLHKLEKIKENEIIIASSIMYVARKHTVFLGKHWKYLKIIIDKLFEFINDESIYIQDMAISSLNDIFVNERCSKHCLIPKNHNHGDKWYVFWDVLLSEIQHLNLSDQQNDRLYTALSVIISYEEDTWRPSSTYQLNLAFHR